MPAGNSWTGAARAAAGGAWARDPVTGGVLFTPQLKTEVTRSGLVWV